MMAHVGFQGLLCDQQLHERMKQRFAPLSGVVHKLEALNLSEFVDGCSWSIKTSLHRSKTRRFPRYGLENDTA
jgi:hypothetical protein